MIKYLYSAYVGGTSEQLRTAVPKNIAPEHMTRLDLPTGLERPKTPFHNQFYFDKNLASPALPTPLWYDAPSDAWKDYAGVSVQSSDCLISELSFKRLPNSLHDDYKANISGLNISVSVPFGTSVTALKAHVIASAKSVLTSNSAPFVSDVTALNFTAPKTILVTAEDGTHQTYTITVTVLPQVAPITYPWSH